MGVMVNKETPINATELTDSGLSNQSVQYKQTPMTYKGPVPSMVDKVVISSNESEHFIVKVK